MMSSDLQSRRLSVSVFSAVVRKGRGLEEEFAAQISAQETRASLEPRDRMFVRMLVTTALRRLGQIDDLLKRFLKKPISEKAFYVSDVLRLATAQLVFMDTPPHAAVSTAVALVKESPFSGFSGLTNAVLHRLAEQGKNLAQKQNAARLNTPAWLMREWEKAYGKEAADRIAAAALTEAPTDFTVKGDPALWAERLNAEPMPTGTLRRFESASIPALDGFEDGAWWVQDLSAAVPVSLFGDLTDKNTADLCAAPGGKTAQMAVKGAKVVAVDISARRIERLAENMKRLKLPVKTVADDAFDWIKGQKPETYDALLLDAPCSATGTLRRHPDVACHRTPDDVARLNVIQRYMLEKAVTLLKQDGVLVYCVCSILPSEGRDLINDVTAQGMFERIPVTESDVPAEMVSPDGDLLILPSLYADKGGCDGFFAARLKRKG